MIEEEKSSTYNPQYREDRSLNEQNIKRESLSMIALFHLYYWCNSDEEKEQLKQLFKSNEEKHQAEIREKYNPDNLFKKREKTFEPPVEETKQDTQLIEKKENFIQKIFNKIQKIFKK